MTSEKIGAKHGERKRENGCGRSGISESGIPSGWSILTVLSTIVQSTIPVDLLSR